VPVRRRIVFVQHGDYAEAVHRFRSGGKEDYYAQEYTVNFVAGLAAKGHVTTVVTLSRDAASETLPNGVRTQGILIYPRGRKARHAELIEAVSALDPTDLVVASPLRPLIRWAIAREIRILPLFAGSFCGGGLRNRIRNFLLRRLLNHSHIHWVANHSIAASLELARIGVHRGKILPFDWPPLVTPVDRGPKEAPDHTPFRLLYVGSLMESKGVGDTLRAMPRLPACSLTVVGAGPDEEALREIPVALGTAGRVEFRGKISHTEVLAEMRSHDAVLVPSRHEYPEGIPMTIYEALCSRTPLIVSDHPMFAKRVVPERNGLVFRANDSESLAEKVERLRTTPELYRALSEAAGPSAENFLLPLKWQALLELWLEDSPEAEGKLASYSLAHHRYE
jgi:glycosyltransferase involved in cell wall biosynthesis